MDSKTPSRFRTRSAIGPIAVPLASILLSWRRASAASSLGWAETTDRAAAGKGGFEPYERGAVKTLTDQNGQTIIMAAFLMPVLMCFLALALDMGLMFRAQRQMQIAADSAALAGAEELNYGDITAAARADAASNGVTHGVGGATVVVNVPPLQGPHAGDPAFVEAVASQPQPTFFLGVLNRNSMTVGARAVAGRGPTNNCMYTLNPTGTDISVSNGVKVDIPGCAIFSNSSSSTSMTVTGGATLNAQGINLVGGYTINNGAHMTPTTPATGVAPASDPLSYLQPPSYSPSSCLPNPNFGWGSHIIGPGGSGIACYNGLTIANGGTLNLQPGVYVINGALTFAGGTTTTGSGVTFYFPPGGSLSVSNGISFNLSAPTDGTYNGILFYQDRANSNPATFEGGANSSMNGILYFPAANVTLENGTRTTSYATIVSGSITFAGGAAFKDYSQMPGASTPLVAARIVE